MYDRRIYAGYSGVIAKYTSFPDSTDISCSGISPAIIDASIKTYMRTPVSSMPNIESIIESPVGRSPKPADFRRQDPDAWNPVISHLRIKGPIARNPEPAIGRT